MSDQGLSIFDEPDESADGAGDDDQPTRVMEAQRDEAKPSSTSSLPRRSSSRISRPASLALA